MRVNKDLLVELQYELYEVADDSSEHKVEATSPERPLRFIHGVGMMLPAFEAELVGLEEGDPFDFVLKPEDAYGEFRADLQFTLPEDAFFVDGKFDEDIVYEGAEVPMLTSEGETVVGIVLDINDEGVLMDFNHPLAGAELHFVGTIGLVKEPTPEEYSSFFAPAEGCSGCGHDHSEGGCAGCH